ncbi:hypothetical protein FACS1894188_05450 [Clostridia bacterium]|nr:hypothetical protein FACS1894188_05450 [Clostridia bacterium]
MAMTGSFVGHLYMDWGTRRPKRYTDSRAEIPDEAYISIPQADARRLDIFMSNHPTANTEYDAFDENGNFICTLKAQGNVTRGAVYAKQFAPAGNLKGLATFIEVNDLFDDVEINVDVVAYNELVLTPIF